MPALNGNLKDPKAKARVSGSERETGQEQARSFLWASDDIYQQVEESKI